MAYDHRERSCERKIRYKTLIRATNAIKARKKKGFMCLNLVSYKCDYCGGWHNGHKREKGGE